MSTAPGVVASTTTLMMSSSSGYTSWQERGIAITPKCTASLGIPCNMFLLYELYCDYKVQKASPIKRIIMGMSLIDSASSFAWFLSTWAVPKGTFALSAGNRATCTFQGFLLQLAVGAPLYNSSLALFYVLIIKYRWTDEMLVTVERWVHCCILFFAIGTSILLLPLEQYNHVGAVCWVIGDPEECGHSSFTPSDVPCERGDHAWLYGIFLFYMPLWICVIACCTSMFFICCEVNKTTKRLNRYSINGTATHALRRSDRQARRAAIQAILYSLAFLVTWMPSTLWSIAHWFNWSSFWLDLASSFCEPLQGFWNFCIFARTRVSTQAKIWKALSMVFPCCIKYDAQEFPSRRSSAFTPTTYGASALAQHHGRNFSPVTSEATAGIPSDDFDALKSLDPPSSSFHLDLEPSVMTQSPSVFELQPVTESPIIHDLSSGKTLRIPSLVV